MKIIYEAIIEKGKNNFNARFVCCLSIKFSDDIIYSYSGEIAGNIIWPPKGNNGFGYDPFFVALGERKTFGELKHDRKIRIDHRSEALKKLIKSHLNDS